MKLLINALSARALSGWYVLNGHLRQFCEQTDSRHSIYLLIDAAQRDKLKIPDRAKVIETGTELSPWHRRYLWEQRNVCKIVRREGIDRVLNMSGSITGKLGVPEYTVALNPWAMLKGIPKTTFERFKSVLQKQGYRKAMKHSAGIFFCSDHLRQLYQQINRGPIACPTHIVHIGLDDEVFEIAEKHRVETPKQPGLILGVSAWAPWKGADRLVRVLAKVRSEVPEARLRLVGPWPDAKYKELCLRTIQDEGQGDAVEILGSVPREELYFHYAQAQIFALLSQAESYGIPALEAQAFGTPTIGSTGNAMAEIAGNAGRFFHTKDFGNIPEHITQIMNSPNIANEMSEASRTNSKRFTWQAITRSMTHVLPRASSANQ